MSVSGDAANNLGFGTAYAGSTTAATYSLATGGTLTAAAGDTGNTASLYLNVGGRNYTYHYTGIGATDTGDKIAADLNKFLQISSGTSSGYGLGHE